jgi:hypothetical protein
MDVEKVFSILSLFQIRWVVESANARIKNFKWLDRVLPTNQVPFIADYVRIVCAISNRYFPALGRTVNKDDDIQLAREMQQKSTEVLQLCPFFCPLNNRYSIHLIVINLFYEQLTYTQRKLSTDIANINRKKEKNQPQIIENKIDHGIWLRTGTHIWSVKPVRGALSHFLL